MCGIVGVIGSPLPTRGVLESMRDAIAHRGPDGAGVWRAEGVALAHRRLAVLDPGEAGHQPMVSHDEHAAIVYNGELYNDADLRRQLVGPWNSACDTETVLRWLSEGRPVSSLRGMYALAFVDTRARTLTLARDPLGIKPLYWMRLPGRVLFASEAHALFMHPDAVPEPDPVGVSLYMSSLRTSMERQTMFRGVHAVAPGERLTFLLDDPEREPVSAIDRIVPDQDEPGEHELRERMDESIRLHLRSDVSLCAMLSGGLDSTILVDRAKEHVGSLHTYCAGVDTGSGDLAHAASVADELRTRHRSVLIDEARFVGLWQDTVERTGLPLTTPNEIAIRLIARALREDDQIVTLSGEGADELFAGYEGPLQQAADFIASPDGRSDGAFQLTSNAWVPGELKPALLSGAFARDIGDDSSLLALYDSVFMREAEGARTRLDAHLRFQRRVNLAGLLHRLDSATMLESVEGRTPFADASIASAASAIPIERLYQPTGTTCASRTKLALRQAYRGRVPEAAVSRRKESFPLPFESWMTSMVASAIRSEASGIFFQPAAKAAVLSDPVKHWNLAWPMLNIIMWAERWWGDGAARDGQPGYANAASTLGTAESSRLV